MAIKPRLWVFAITNIVTIAFLAIKNINEVHKKSACLIRRLMCPGTDLNRYDRCGSQDFKSCVSTNSTTRAISKYFKNYSSFVGSRSNRAVPTHWELKKILRLAEDLMSGRPGSNRPPRPWQGRALPNELLPHKKNYYKNIFFSSNPPPRPYGRMLYHPDSYRESYFRIKRT